MNASDGTLRQIFENMPDVLVTVDRNGSILSLNRGWMGTDPQLMLGTCGFDIVIPEHQATCRNALAVAFDAGNMQTIEVQDIAGQRWSARAVAIDKIDNRDEAVIICSNVTKERSIVEALEKEQRLLRQVLELQERERRLMAYEIHDGFAQQLTGALLRLQGFREAHSRDPLQAWDTFDGALRLLCRAINETRRLISNLRPPVLDKSGVVEAIEYLVCEYDGHSGPKIEFVHDVAFDRLAPPLEATIFRVVQESLQNASRHSRSDRIRVELKQCEKCVYVEVRDWVEGFRIEAVDEQRFGLRGIRERARLLGGRVIVDSAPGKGTRVSVELPLVDFPTQGEQ
jgi:signal transduction histidine kinase